MLTQKELLLKAIELLNQNPNLEIKIFADNSEMLDEYGWTEHRINSVEISDYYIEDGDGLILTEEDSIREKIAEEFENRPDLADEEIEERITALYAERVKKVIAIRTGF